MSAPIPPDGSAEIVDMEVEEEEEHPSLVEGVQQEVVKRYLWSFTPMWAAAFLVDPIHFERTPAGWVLPFAKLTGTGVVEGASRTQREDAVEALVQLAGGEDVRGAVMREVGRLRMEGLPSSVWDIAEALTEREQQQNGRVQLQSAEHRRLFWGHHMSPSFPHMSQAAVRLLSAHVTSAASERNWSVMGNFTKTRNKLALERAKKLAYIKSNGVAGGGPQGGEGSAHEVLLTLVDLVYEGEGPEGDAEEDAEGAEGGAE